MKLTARISIILSALFALVCYGVAYSGFSSLGGLADPVQLRDARGFAWFWAFLGTVILGIAGLSWWATGQEEE